MNLTGILAGLASASAFVLQSGHITSMSEACLPFVPSRHTDSAEGKLWYLGLVRRRPSLAAREVQGEGVTRRDDRIESGHMARAVHMAAEVVSSDLYTRSARLLTHANSYKIDESSELLGGRNRLGICPGIENRRRTGRQPRRRAGVSEPPSTRARGASLSVVE